jgi:transcriptional regulator with XRE-family HTH domain
MKDDKKRAAATPGGGGRMPDAAEAVHVRDFQPERGVAVLEFGRQRVRYTREKTAEQVYAMADYLRARRGFATDQEMAEILGVHRTRLIAWKQGMDVPNARNAQLLSHLAVVVRELEEFLDPDVIPDWLLTEQYTLGNRTPVEALREGHLAEVLQAANATEHGAYI